MRSSQPGRWPDFMVIGAMKAGTTSLHAYLKQHPRVFMPELKELRFFAYDPDNPDHRAKVPRVFPVTTADQYRALFAAAAPDQVAGEASPEYLNSPIAAARIRAVAPAARLIVSLRNPVDTAYSLRLMAERSGRADAQRGWDADPDDPSVQGCLYFEKLRRFVARFPPEQLKIVLFDDLVSDPRGTVRELYTYLGVSSDFEPDVSRAHNRGGVPRSRGLYRLGRNRRLRRLAMLLPDAARERLSALRTRNLDKPPPLSPRLRVKLSRFYAEDLARVGELLDLDLCARWLHPAGPTEAPRTLPTGSRPA